MRYRSSNSSMVFFCVVLISALMLILGQSAFAWPPANTLFVYPGATTPPYYSNIYYAVEAATDGDVIVISAGEYNDTEVDIDVAVTLKTDGYVKWSSSAQLFALGADNVRFQGISFALSGTEELADMGDYDYFMDCCTLRCKNFDFGQGKSHWTGCYVCPKTATGWTISGSTTEVQFRNCKLGDDMPGPGEAVFGLSILDDSHFAAYYSFFQSDSFAFKVDASKLNIFHSMVIGNRGAAIMAADSSRVSSMFSTFECQDTTFTYATVILEDSALGHFNNSVFRHLATNTGNKRSIYTATLDSVLFIDCNFNGTVYLYHPPNRPSGNIYFYGHNSVIHGGVVDSTGTNSTRYGSADKMYAVGEAQFDTTAAEKRVYVNGMPSTAKVVITYNNSSAVLSGDSVFAVEVYFTGGSFKVIRSNTNNTSGLKFYWRAEWEDD